MGVLIIRILLFRVPYSGPLFSETPVSVLDLEGSGFGASGGRTSRIEGSEFRAQVLDSRAEGEGSDQHRRGGATMNKKAWGMLLKAVLMVAVPDNALNFACYVCLTRKLEL